MGQTSFPRLWRFISVEYLPFVVKMGKCVFSDKWKANERVKAWIASDPKSRTKVKCTRQSILRAWATNVQRFLTNFFFWSFGSSSTLPRLVVLRFVVICLLFVSLVCWLKMSHFSCTFVPRLDATTRRTDNGSISSTNSTTCKQRKPKNTGSV